MDTEIWSKSHEKNINSSRITDEDALPSPPSSPRPTEPESESSLTSTSTNSTTESVAKLYDPLSTSVNTLVNESRKQLLSPSYTSAAITHAITAEYPQTRYSVGWDAKWAGIVRSIVPERVVDLGFWVLMGNQRD